jgi:hypothetical protein
MLFNVVIDDPAYSGLQQREYKQSAPKIDSIEVEVRELDDVMKERDFKVSLIKIDVEGGELDVLKGATAILTSDKPILIFEFGKGASEYYGTMPHHLFELLEIYGYGIWTLGDFWKSNKSLDSASLKSIYEKGSDYYFVAKATGN